MSDIPKTSRAACVVAFQKPLELREVPIPDSTEPGAILVKTEVASICGSDVHLWQGELGVASHLELPVILGHEMMGRVVRLGPGVPHDPAGQPLAEGDRIVWTHASCGECYMCTVALQVSLQPRLIVEKQLTILGVMSGDTDHYYKALQFLRHNRDRFTFHDMLSNRYRLDQINEALKAMRAFHEVKPVVVMA